MYLVTLWSHYLKQKNLNFEALRKSMAKCFSDIPDSRQQGKCIYSQHDVPLNGNV
jgi:hypothetical protein